MLLPKCYRLATFAATAVLAEARWHEAGHCDGSDTGQGLPFEENTAGVFAADAGTVAALTDEPSGQCDPHCAGFDTGQPTAFAADTRVAAAGVFAW